VNAPLHARLRIDRGTDPAFRLEVDFAAPQGITVVCGPSGSGKTTLLLSILGSLEPSAGRLTLADRTLFDVKGLRSTVMQHERLWWGESQQLPMDRDARLFDFASRNLPSVMKVRIMAASPKVNIDAPVSSPTTPAV